MASPSRPSQPLSLIASIVAAQCVALSARADEFSWQLSGVTSRAEAGDFERDSWAVDGTYFLNPIDDSAGPYALASFLNPTTRVSAAASKSESSLGVVDDPTAYTLSGAYVLPGAKWYIGANYAKTDFGTLPLPVTRSDNKGYGLLAGRYFGANTTLELGLGRSEQSFESSLACPPGVQICIAVPYAVETTNDTVRLEVLHVRRFRSLTYSLQGSVSETRAEADISSPLTSLVPLTSPDDPSLRAYSVAAELFPTQRIGVRVGYSRPDGEGADADAYNVAATWFFKPRVAVQFSLMRVSIDDDPFDTGGSESAAIRFIGRL